MKKKLSFLMLFTFLISMVASAQIYQDWKWLHQAPQGNTLRWVKMWDANNWYAIGFSGTFMKTSNAGATWTFHHKAAGQYLSYTGQRINLYDAHFFNQNTGVVVGSSSVNGGFARTTDGGITWDTNYSYSSGAGAIYQVFFLNNNTGFSAGTGTPKIWKTTNGGINWTGITTGPTGTVYDIYAFNENNLIVAYGSGNVLKSTDGGAFWTEYTTGNTSINYKIDFINENTGYVTGAAGKFAYTTNGGINWTLANVVGSTSAMYDLDIVTTSTPESIKLDEGFESTTFPPAGWSSINVLGSNVWERSVTQFYSGAASASITYQSTGGDDWLISKKIMGISATDSLSFWWKNAFSSPYPPDSIQIKVSTTDSLIASFTSNILTINGATTPFTWTRYAVSLGAFAGQNIYIAFRHFDTDGNGGFLDDVMVQGTTVSVPTVYVTGDSFNLYKTTNNGTNWDTVGFLSPTQPWTSTQYATDFSPSGDTVLVVGAFGLFNRRLNPSNRQAFTTFIKPGILYDVWAQSGTGLVLAVGARGSSAGAKDQIIRSTNGGANWSLVTINGNPLGYFNSIWMIDNNTGWVCGSNSTAYKTTNGGLNWDSVPLPYTSATLILSRVQFVNANTGWIFSKTSVTGDSTIVKTTNGGTTWFKQQLTTGTGTIQQIYWADFIDANTGYCVNYTPRPYKTTDGGNTWTLNTIVDAFGGFMYGIDMVNANTGFIVGSSGRVYKTTDGGTLWDTLTKPGNASFSFYGIRAVNENIAAAAGSLGSTIVTSNGGTNWILHNTSGSTMYNLYLTPNAGFTVGTNSYVFKNINLPTGIENNLTGIPTDYELAQNYPNPFNPTTTIKFALPKAGLVTMKIYDMLGREVMRAINNQAFNAGWNQYIFDGSRLSSGVYFYSLVIDNKVVDTKRMVLLK